MNNLKKNRKLIGLTMGALLLATPMVQSIHPVLAATPAVATTEAGSTYADLQGLITVAQGDVSTAAKDDTGTTVLPSLRNLNTALASATAVSSDATATTIQPAYDALNTAVNAFASDYPNDLSQYQSVTNTISSIQEYINGTENVAHQSIEEMNANIAKANAVLATPYTDSAKFQADLQTAITALNNTNVYTQAYYDLKDLVDTTEAYQTGHTTGDYKLPTDLAETIVLSKSVNIANSDDEGKLKTQISILNDAYTAYQNEYTAYEALQTALTAADAKLKDGKTYTADSIAAINSAVADASTKVTTPTWTADQSTDFVTAANAATKAINDAVAAATVEPGTEPEKPTTPSNPSKPVASQPTDHNVTALRQNIAKFSPFEGLDTPLSVSLTAARTALAKGVTGADAAVLNYALNKAYQQYLANAATYTTFNGVGQVYTKGQGILLYDRPAGQIVKTASVQDRVLADQSEWKIFQKATLADGSTWYEVGKNQWINAETVFIQKAEIGTVTPEKGTSLMKMSENKLTTTDRTLAGDTAWQIWGSMLVGQNMYYNLGADQWANAADITITK